MMALVVFTLAVSYSHAQSPIPDPQVLLKQLPTQQGDEKIQTLYSLAKSQDFLYPDRVAYAKEGISLALKNNSQKLLVTGYSVLGSILLVQSINSLDSASDLFDKSYALAVRWNFRSQQVQARLLQAKAKVLRKKPLEAMELTEDAARIAESLSDSSLMALAYAALSLRYHDVALDSSALTYGHLALSLANRKRDELTYGNVMNYLAIAYEAVGEYEKALRCWQAYSDIATAHHLHLELGFCHLNMAATYKSLGNRAEGLRMTFENIRHARAHGMRNIEASALGYVAEEKVYLQQYDSTIYYRKASNAIWRELSFVETPFFIDNELEIGQCEIKLGHVEKGLGHIKAYYQKAKQNQYYFSQKKALKILSDTYAELHDYEKGNLYLTEWIQINDSVQSEERVQEMARVEYRYALTKAAREKELVSRENESNKALIRQKNITQIILIGAIGILMVSIILIIRLFRQKLRANQELAISNTTIAQQKEELEAALDNSLRMQQQLIHSEKMASLGQLTAGIAHEINNPLNFISGGASALEGIHNDVLAALKNPQAVDPQHMEALAGEMKTIMDAIKNGVSRSTHIIKDLRTFSSPIDQIRKDSRTNLKSAVTSAIVLMNSKIQNANITVETELKDLIAHANESLIQQVLVNLLDNAVHALEGKPNERRIWIQTETHANRHHIHVRDNGPGIPPEHQARILEPFFTTKEVGKGTGLGLAISYGIIQKHGGDLRFTSEVGKGTEFIISLPAST